jgi:hypothetical protein
MQFNDLKAETAANAIGALVQEMREQNISDFDEPLASLLAAERELSRARIAAFNAIRAKRHETA